MQNLIIRRHFTARREKHIIIKLDEIFGQPHLFWGGEKHSPPFLEILLRINCVLANCQCAQRGLIGIKARDLQLRKRAGFLEKVGCTPRIPVLSESDAFDFALPDLKAKLEAESC
jgi:hypothetical protein